ncbi:MAG: ATP-binding protein, partial [Chloroflexota bacterium]
LAFVLAGAESPEQLAVQSGLGSPFFNIFGYVAALGPLTEAEALALIAHSPRPFSSEDIAWILQASGRWPILLQILCRERFLALEEDPPSMDWQEEALRQCAPFLYLKQGE